MAQNYEGGLEHLPPLPFALVWSHLGPADKLSVVRTSNSLQALARPEIKSVLLHLTRSARECRVWAHLKRLPPGVELHTIHFLPKGKLRASTEDDKVWEASLVECLSEGAACRDQVPWGHARASTFQSLSMGPTVTPWLGLAMPHLHSLTLLKCVICPRSITGLLSCRRLVTLGIQDCVWAPRDKEPNQLQIEEYTSVLGCLTTLRRLELEGMPLPCLGFLSRLSQVSKLKLVQCRLSWPDPAAGYIHWLRLFEQIGVLHGLTELHVEPSDASSKLFQLCADGTLPAEPVPAPALRLLLERCPQLTTLHLGSQVALTWEAFALLLAPPEPEPLVVPAPDDNSDVTGYAGGGAGAGSSGAAGSVAGSCGGSGAAGPVAGSCGGSGAAGSTGSVGTRVLWETSLGELSAASMLSTTNHQPSNNQEHTSPLGPGAGQQNAAPQQQQQQAAPQQLTTSVGVLGVMAAAVATPPPAHRLQTLTVGDIFPPGFGPHSLAGLPPGHEMEGLGDVMGEHSMAWNLPAQYRVTPNSQCPASQQLLLRSLRVEKPSVLGLSWVLPHALRTAVTCPSVNLWRSEDLDHVESMAKAMALHARFRPTRAAATLATATTGPQPHAMVPATEENHRLKLTLRPDAKPVEMLAGILQRHHHALEAAHTYADIQRIMSTGLQAALRTEHTTGVKEERSAEELPVLASLLSVLRPLRGAVRHMHLEHWELKPSQVYRLSHSFGSSLTHLTLDGCSIVQRVLPSIRTHLPHLLCLELLADCPGLSPQELSVFLASWPPEHALVVRVDRRVLDEDVTQRHYAQYAEAYSANRRRLQWFGEAPPPPQPQPPAAAGPSYRRYRHWH